MRFNVPSAAIGHFNYQCHIILSFIFWAAFLKGGNESLPKVCKYYLILEALTVWVSQYADLWLLQLWPSDPVVDTDTLQDLENVGVELTEGIRSSSIVFSWSEEIKY